LQVDAAKAAMPAMPWMTLARMMRLKRLQHALPVDLARLLCIDCTPVSLSVAQTTNTHQLVVFSCMSACRCTFDNE
jgi:hypothetical protein